MRPGALVLGFAHAFLPAARRARCARRARLSSLLLAVLAAPAAHAFLPAARRAPCARRARLSSLLLAVLAAPAAHAFLPAAEEAPVVVVGRLGDVVEIDTHGRRAELAVERTVAGQAGEPVVVAWEELSRGRPARLAPGERLLVALAPLPSSSLWRRRFAGEQKPPWIVAAQQAPPGEAEATTLAAYLALAADDRERAPGIALLARLAGAEDPLANDAVARLDTIDDLAGRIDSAAAAALSQIALDPGRSPARRRSVVRLAGERRLAPMKPAIESLAAPGSPLEADALVALAALEGGLAENRIQALLLRPEPPIRAAAARLSRSPLAERALPPLLTADPAAEVRLAAAETLAGLGTPGSLEAAVVAFHDADGTVRAGAVRAVARRGPAALPVLSAALARGGDDAASAIAALALLGPAGRPLIVDAAATHPDEKVRTIAALALGKAPGHEH